MTHLVLGRLDFVPEDADLIPQWRAFLQELNYNHTIEQATKFWYLALWTEGYNPKYQAYQHIWSWVRKYKSQLEVEDPVEEEEKYWTFSSKRT